MMKKYNVYRGHILHFLRTKTQEMYMYAEAAACIFYNLTNIHENQGPVVQSIRGQLVKCFTTL